MRVVKNSATRKAEILFAAYQLFLAKGYENTSVMDIIEKVNIAKGTLYHHFQSKEEILDAVITLMLDHITEEVRAITTSCSLDANAKLKRILQETNEELAENEALIADVHHRENEKIHFRALNAMVKKLSPVLADLIAQGVKEDIFRTEHPLACAEFLLTGHQYLFDSGFVQWSAEEYQKRACAVSALFERVLGAKPGSMAYVSGLLLARFSAYENTKMESSEEKNHA